MAETDPNPPAPLDDAIPQLFAELTMRFEDGAALAAEGQAASLDLAIQIALVSQLRSLAEQIDILLDAVIAFIIDRDRPTASGAS